MKHIIKAAMALGLGMAIASGAYAQNDGPRHGGMPSHEQRIKHMTEALSLTADQQTKIKSLMESEKAQMDKLRDDTSLAQDARRESAMKIRQDTKAAIRSTLTADQQAKFDKQQAEMRQRGPRGPRPEGGDNGEKPQDPPPPPPAS